MRRLIARIAHRLRLFAQDLQINDLQRSLADLVTARQEVDKQISRTVLKLLEQKRKRRQLGASARPRGPRYPLWFARRQLEASNPTREVQP